MGRTLYVTDLDGTLLDYSSRVTPESARIITELTHAGALITVATARTPATVEPLLAATETNIPAIVMTGAALWHRKTQQYSDVKLIEDDAAVRIMELADAHGINPFVYTLGENGRLDIYHDGPMSKADRKFVDERRGLPLKKFHIDEREGAWCKLPPTGHCVLYFAMGPMDRVAALAESLNREVVCSVSSYTDIFNKDTGIIEVFAPGVSKAEAVKQLAQRTGAERIVVFGDNLNDIPMMAVADTAVAVDNALDEVKAAADEVTGNNNTDAVARYIAEDFETHH